MSQQQLIKVSGKQADPTVGLFLNQPFIVKYLILPGCVRAGREAGSVLDGVRRSNMQHLSLCSSPCCVISTSGQSVENIRNKSAAIHETDLLLVFGVLFSSTWTEPRLLSLIFGWGKTLPPHCPSTPTSGLESLSGGLGMGRVGVDPPRVFTELMCLSRNIPAV